MRRFKSCANTAWGERQYRMDAAEDVLKNHVSILGFPVCRTCVDHVCVAVLEKWYILGPHHQMSLPYKTVSQIMIGVDLLQNGYHLGTYPWPPSNNWVNNYLLQNGTVIFIALMIDVKNDPGTKSFHARSFFYQNGSPKSKCTGPKAILFAQVILTPIQIFQSFVLS